MKKQGRVIILLLLVLVVVLFAVLNMNVVPISFGFTKLSLPLVVVIIGSLLIGALITFLVSSISHFSQQREHKKLAHKVAQMENDTDKAIAKAVQAKTADLQAQLKAKDAEIAALKKKIPQDL